MLALALAALVATATDSRDDVYGVVLPRYDLYAERDDCPEGSLRAYHVPPLEPPAAGCWQVQGDLIVLTFGDETATVERKKFHHVFNRAT
jgi:hypothetical protein